MNQWKKKSLDLDQDSQRNQGAKIREKKPIAKREKTKNLSKSQKSTIQN